jgi:hypothetical protein
VYRRLEVSAELGVGVGELAYRAAQSLRDGHASPLGGPGRPSRAATMADGRGQVVHECIELRLGTLGAGEVVGQLSVVDLLLQIADSGLVGASGGGVDHLAGRGLRRTGASEIEAVVLAARRGQ